MISRKITTLLTIVALIAWLTTAPTLPAESPDTEPDNAAATAAVRAMLEWHLAQDALLVEASFEFDLDGDRPRSDFTFYSDAEGHYRRISRSGMMQSVVTFDENIFTEMRGPNGTFLRSCYDSFDDFIATDSGIASIFFFNNLIQPLGSIRELLDGEAEAAALGQQKLGDQLCDVYAVPAEAPEWHLYIDAADPHLLRSVELPGEDNGEDMDGYQIEFREWRFGDEARAARPEVDYPSNRRRVHIVDEIAILDSGPHQFIPAAEGEEPDLKSPMGGTDEIVLMPVYHFGENLTDERRAEFLTYLGTLQQIEWDYQDRGVRIMAILYGGHVDAERFLAAIEGLGWTYNFAVDEAGQFPRMLRVQGYPTLLINDCVGITDAVYTGTSECLDLLVRDDIERLLAARETENTNDESEAEAAASE